MAKVFSNFKSAFSLAAFGASAALLLAASGCARQQVVDNLPPPNFNGPNVVQPDRPVVVQRPPVQVPVAPEPKGQPAPPPQVAKAPAGIPKDWIPRANAEHRQWNYIVIHHSATPAGSLAMIDREHKEKGWDGCGYHFVIGNGTDTPDGKVEPSIRWAIQKWGAHAKTPDNQFNEHGIGICMVGNFDVDRPTAAQLASLAKLVSFLEHKYGIPAANVIGHRETKPTDCPGRNVNVASIRRAAAQLAVADGTAGDGPQSAELSTDDATAQAAAGPTATAELLVSRAAESR